MTVDNEIPMQFVRTAYAPDDWIAIFLKSYATGHTLQRVGPRALFLDPRLHAWLRAMNAHGYNCYVSVNTVAPGGRSRRRDAIRTIRHVFLETDRNGSVLLATIAARPDLPAPSYVIESSPNRFHVLWRARGFCAAYVERLQRDLAQQLGTDPAATPCSQLTRLPGYRNHKRTPSWLVTVAYGPSNVRHAPPVFPVPPALPPIVAPPLRVSPAASVGVLDRARRYLARVEPAIAGQHGDLHTYRVCCRIVRGFGLDDQDAFRVLIEWNERCVPPWTARDLAAKIAHARKYGREPLGKLCGQRERVGWP